MNWLEMNSIIIKAASKFLNFAAINNYEKRKKGIKCQRF